MKEMQVRDESSNYLIGSKFLFIYLRIFFILKSILMKKLKKIKLKSAYEVLSDQQMKGVLGGSSGSSSGSGYNKYRCCCGMGSNVYCRDIYAVSQDAAVGHMGTYCPNGIGGCF